MGRGNFSVTRTEVTQYRIDSVTAPLNLYVFYALTSVNKYSMLCQWFFCKWKLCWFCENWLLLVVILSIVADSNKSSYSYRAVSDKTAWKKPTIR